MKKKNGDAVPSLLPSVVVSGRGSPAAKCIGLDTSCSIGSQSSGMVRARPLLLLPVYSLGLVLLLGSLSSRNGDGLKSLASSVVAVMTGVVPLDWVLSFFFGVGTSKVVIFLHFHPPKSSRNTIGSAH
jgi:hypothetical protein